jgi:hypothetical protein
MPRYFFHIHDGESMPDNDGIEMPNADEACAQAVVSGSNASPEGCVAKLPEAR